MLHSTVLSQMSDKEYQIIRKYYFGLPNIFEIFIKLSGFIKQSVDIPQKEATTAFFTIPWAVDEWQR